MKLALAFSFMLGAALSMFVASKIASAQAPRIDHWIAESPTTQIPKADPKGPLFTILGEGLTELARINGDGRVFLNGREVHTDREYRAAMMAMMKGMAGCKQ